MATTETADVRSTASIEPARIVLHDVPWSAYQSLRASEANDHVRMTYLDGTLELMSPEYLHEQGSGRLAMLVRAVARVLGVPYQAAGSTTLRKRRGAKRGQGREPDKSFYFGENAERMAAKCSIDLTVDPPPDLAIEVDNTAHSDWKLPVFARLEVPEVWRYDVAAGTLWFGRLGADRTYSSLDRSEALPVLTPAWVLDVLARGRNQADSRWEAMLEGWIRDELGPRGQAD